MFKTCPILLVVIFMCGRWDEQTQNLMAKGNLHTGGLFAIRGEWNQHTFDS